jgi:hypothetical protein
MLGKPPSSQTVASIDRLPLEPAPGQRRWDEALPLASRQRPRSPAHPYTRCHHEPWAFQRRSMPAATFLDARSIRRVLEHMCVPKAFRALSDPAHSPIGQVPAIRLVSRTSCLVGVARPRVDCPGVCWVAAAASDWWSVSGCVKGCIHVHVHGAGMVSFWPSHSASNARRASLAHALARSGPSRVHGDGVRG